MKRITLLIAILVLIFSFSLCYAVQNKFTDIKETDWYYNALENIAEKGIIGGYPDNTFKPQNNITRAEFTKILLTSLDTYIVKGESFKDVEGHWAEDIIYTAWEKFIIRKADFGAKEYEMDVNYYPDIEITRVEMARMAVRALNLEKEALKRYGKKTKYTDDSTINDTDKGYVIIADENEVMKGYDDMSFKPNGKVTRAEAVQMIVNMLNAKVRITEKRANETKEDVIERVNKTLQERDFEVRLPKGIESSAKYEYPQTYEELIENIESLKVYPYTIKKNDNWELMSLSQFVSNPEEERTTINTIGVIRMEFQEYEMELSTVDFDGETYSILKCDDLIKDKFKAGALIKDGEIINYVAFTGKYYSFGLLEDEMIFKADYIALSKYADDFFKSSNRYDGRMENIMVIFENPF